MKREDEMTMGTEQVRRLIRRRDRRMIAGVAAGLGDYFHVDPIWFRLGFVFMTFLGGAGILAYGVLWLLMPKNADTPPTSVQRRAEAFAGSFRGTPSWIGIALAGLGGLLLVSNLTHWNAAIFWGIALIVAGVAVFDRHASRQEEAVPGEQPAAATAVVPAQPALDTGTAATPPAAVPVEQPRASRAPRERSGLGWLTIGAAMIALGVAAILDVANAVHISLVQYLALPLAILGIGMAVGAFYGRARWLVAPAILLTPFVLAASLIHVPFRGGSGDFTYTPASVAAVHPEYHITAGTMTIDLRGLKLTSPVALHATVVAGHILVYVPTGARIDIRGRAGGGEVALFDRKYDGLNVDVHRQFGSGTTPNVLLYLEAGLGQVEVRS